MTTINQVNQLLTQFNQIVNQDQCLAFDPNKPLKVGIDLGTSSIVLTVLSHENQPIYGSFEYADVVRDGLVVNYGQAVTIVKRLKSQAERVLGVPLVMAAGAIPPGTVGRNQAVVANVIESAELIVSGLIDEPTAASTVLGLKDGAVIDVGGGTTGISIFKGGNVIHVKDEATGGHHMSLVLAGHYGITLNEAEELKRHKQTDSQCFGIVRPVVEKMAEITRLSLEKFPSERLFVVGGASCFKEFAATFGQYLRQPVDQPMFPQFVTPIGIAMNACEGGSIWTP